METNFQCLLFMTLFIKYSTANCVHIENGVTATEIQEIVNVHNFYRLQHAHGNVSNMPKAANMLMIRWDKNLAVEAQKIANTCDFNHVKVTDNRFKVGQNLFTSWSNRMTKEAQWKRAIKDWYDEIKEYQFGKGQYNHFTQVIWHNSDKIGCGYVAFTEKSGVRKLYVCNYGPAGNVNGQEPYKEGEGCSNLCELRSPNSARYEYGTPQNKYYYGPQIPSNKINQMNQPIQLQTTQTIMTNSYNPIIARNEEFVRSLYEIIQILVYYYSNMSEELNAMAQYNQPNNNIQIQPYIYNEYVPEARRHIPSQNTDDCDILLKQLLRNHKSKIIKPNYSSDYPHDMKGRKLMRAYLPDVDNEDENFFLN